jgi:hypothetical protein
LELGVIGGVGGGVLDGAGALLLDLGDPVQAVVGEGVGVDLGAGAVVADLGEVAVGVVEVLGEVLALGVGVSGVVAHQLDRVGDHGAVGVAGQLDLLREAGRAEGIAAKADPAARVGRLVDRLPGGAGRVGDGVGRVGGSRAGVAHEDLVGAVLGDVQVPGKAVAAGPGGVGGVVVALVATCGRGGRPRAGGGDVLAVGVVDQHDLLADRDAVVATGSELAVRVEGPALRAAGGPAGAGDRAAGLLAEGL